MTWLTGYSYRKKITITGQTGADTNYQVKLQIGNASGGDFNLSGHAQSFPNDIRFTSSNSSTQLNYWTENVASSPITVWVNVADSLNSNVDIYCYYGKTSDATTSSGTNTFLFFDDFLGSSIDTSKWQRMSSGGSTSISNSILDMWTSSDNYETWMTYNQYPVNSCAISKFRISTDASTGAGVGFYNGSSYTAWETWGSKHWSIWNSPNSSIISRTADYSTYRTVKIGRDGITKVDFYTDNISDGNISTYIPTTSLGGYLYITSRTGSIHLYVDWFAIGKYVSPEPTFGTIGVEELGITATAMTLSQSENPCRTGICTITANVTWQNLGSSSITFRPKILIDGITEVQAASDTTITGPYPATSSLIQITTPTLPAGTHSICPYPN